MPIRMYYQPSEHSEPRKIDVYHFHNINETLECFATGWLLDVDTWVTVPVYMLKPIKKKTKKILNEEAS